MSRVGTVISSHLTGACGLRGAVRVGCMHTGTSTAATPEATVQLSLTDNRQCLFTPNPRPTPGPEPAPGSAGEVPGAAAALASSAPDLDPSRTGSKAATKPVSVQHDCSQPSSESNFNKDFYTRTCCNCKFYLSHYTYLH